MEDEDDYSIGNEVSTGDNVTAVRIKAFDMGSYENDKKVLFDFYDTLGECENLIIDITPNSGGGESYWMDLIVAPYIDSPISNDNYSLVSIRVILKTQVDCTI